MVFMVYVYGILMVYVLQLEVYCVIFVKFNLKSSQFTPLFNRIKSVGSDSVYRPYLITSLPLHFNGELKDRYNLQDKGHMTK